MQATQSSTASGKSDRSQQFAALRYVSEHLELGMEVGPETGPTPECGARRQPLAMGAEIEQLLLHLVRNAAEATPEGGRIVVSVYGARDGALEGFALTGEEDVRGGELVSRRVLSVEGAGPAGLCTEAGDGLDLERVRPALEGVVMRRQRKFLIEGAAGWIAC